LPTIRLGAHVSGAFGWQAPRALPIRTRTSWPFEGYADQERW
jgi:hypothetical protein